jgi:multicomponent Na+:H+ antiporter subunit B
MVQKSEDIIVRTIARIIIPFIQIYALYVIMHGHYSPGGGFQGGVILGASLVLSIITHGLDRTRAKFSELTVTILGSLGIFIYAGVGVLAILLMGNFLDYGKLAKIFNTSTASARSLGILIVEIGVGLTVMAIMVSIFVSLSSSGDDSNKKEEKTEEVSQ